MNNAGGLILALNSGSSSLKLGCFAQDVAGEKAVLTGTAEGIGRAEGSLRLEGADGAVLLQQEHVCESQEEALKALAAAIGKHLPGPVAAVVHRVVHGGPKLREHQRITPEVIATLQASVHLAPLHIPAAVKLMEQAEALYPGLPQFACFDTTFHRTMPEVATHLPLPAKYFAEGVQRYGFHGLSCESVMRRLGATPPRRVVIAHLGNGSSVTAVCAGRSIDTTMGLSPTGGVPMGTRSGDLDPEVLLYVMRAERVGPDEVEAFVNHGCGLAGLAGGESDMQRLLEREGRGDAAAGLAVEVFCTDVRKAIGGYAALLGGLDLLVCTGGIGEHSAAVRERITAGLAFLFVGPMDDAVKVLPAQEEQEMAVHCRALMR